MARRHLAPGALLALALGTLAIPLGAGPAVAGGGCHQAPTDHSGTVVMIKDYCFSATVLRVQPGQKVTWRNVDGTTHLVTGHGGFWGTNGELQPGDSYAVRFDDEGIYPYSCMLHYGMNAVVVVGNPFAAGSGTGSDPAAVAAQANPPAKAKVATPPVSSESTSGWRTATFVGFALFLVTALALASQRIATRRSRVRAIST
jgi:plastocyanin